MFPEVWPHFNLMDDAMEGRLEGIAPILKADFLPISKPKKRNASMMMSPPVPSLASEPEIEVSLHGDEDDDEGSQLNECTMQEMEQVMEREKRVMERERMVLQRERAVLDREVAALDRDRASLERERATIEREKAVIEREKAAVEKDRDVVSKQRLALEREKARLERLSAAKERTEEGKEDGGHVTDSDLIDRKERFLNLFEKLIENF